MPRDDATDFSRFSRFSRGDRSSGQGGRAAAGAGWGFKDDAGAEAEAPRPLFRPLPPAEPYPVEALGGPLRDAAEAIHLRTQAPRAICAQAALGAAALAVQGLADVALPTGEAKPCGLFLLTIAESGERKSACDGWALRGVREREAELREEHDIEWPAWRDRREAWDKARAEALTKAKGYEAKRAALESLGPEPPPPLEPLLVVSEPTLEGLAKLFQRGHPSLGLFTGEAAGFLGGHGMQDDTKARTAAGLSDLWDGTPLRRVRAGDGATVLPGRRLSAHLMAQPEVARLLTRDKLIAGAGGQGLINRFLTVAPETAAGTRMFRDAPPEAVATLAGFAQRVHDLLARPPAMEAGARNELAPRPLPLSAAARREWIAFQQATERALAPGGPLEPVRGLANKLPEHATRLAAVLTLLVDPDAAEVSGTAMGSGIVLAQHYAGEALRLAEASGVSADLLLAERVRLWLLHDWPEPYVSLPDLYQRGPRAVRTQEAARRAVATLEAHEHLLREPGGATIGGQRRREAWLIVGRSAP